MTMRLLLQHVSRSITQEFRVFAKLPAHLQLRTPRSFVCVQCRLRGSSSSPRRGQKQHSFQGVGGSLDRNRQLSCYSKLRREEKPSSATTTTESTTPLSTRSSQKDKGDPQSSINGSSVHVVPDEDLPSHKERKRWKLSRRFNQMMDDLMPKLALASQRINIYTGTDYSGIEALRKEIIDQEKLVRARIAEVQRTKDALETARAAESSSRKEVVGLLERKHAWSDADLERYMNLIRSEHLNDQGVQAAKDDVTAAEMSLEEARTRLEKRERMQYHEEQIWSDTIRRNSTWVTFGLMGFNIFLLLATTVIIEPWRRKRMVKEIRRTLEENQAVAPTITLMTKEIDAVVEPKGVAFEDLEKPQVQRAKSQEEPSESAPAQPSQAEGPEPLEAPVTHVPSVDAHFELKPSVPSALSSEIPVSGVEFWKNCFHDLFSDQRITVRKVDITTIALEGAAAGAAVIGLLLVLLRPK